MFVIDCRPPRGLEPIGAVEAHADLSHFIALLALLIVSSIFQEPDSRGRSDVQSHSESSPRGISPKSSAPSEATTRANRRAGSQARNRRVTLTARFSAVKWRSATS